MIICRKKWLDAATAAAAAVLVAATLAGCASQKEVLVPKDASVPPGMDLSGRWALQEDFADMQRRISRAIRRTDGIDDGRVMRGIAEPPSGRRSGRRGVGGLVHVFLENAPSLKITQTDAGLFISFDRSVVEEYRFGEARTVRVGGAVAQRVSGWEGDQYVIETLDEDGLKLTERYRLTDSDRRLTREIVLRSNELEEVTIVQTFRREVG